MSGPIFSPDGEWLWTGAEWVPAPPTNETNPAAATTSSGIFVDSTQTPTEIPLRHSQTFAGGDLEKWDMTTAQLLFGFGGRINRQRYWIYSILVIISAFILHDTFTLVTTPVLGYDLSIWLGNTFIDLPMCYILTAITVKRLRDSEQGVAMIVAYATFGLLFLISVYAPMETQHAELLERTACFIGMIPGCFMGFESGTRGPNKYGPDPLA